MVISRFGFPWGKIWLLWFCFCIYFSWVTREFWGIQGLPLQCCRLTSWDNFPFRPQTSPGNLISYSGDNGFEGHGGIGEPPNLSPTEGTARWLAQLHPPLHEALWASVYNAPTAAFTFAGLLPIAVSVLFFLPPFLSQTISSHLLLSSWDLSHWFPWFSRLWNSDGTELHQSHSWISSLQMADHETSQFP